MKNNIVLIIILLIFNCTCFSQQGELDSYSSDIFNSEQESLNLLSSLNLNQLSNDNFVLNNQENSILIQQIGDYNTVYSKTQSSQSILILTQNGDYNNIELQVTAPTINGTVIQNGNNNSVSDNIYYSNLDVLLNVIQNGDNLSVNRIGVNSLSNKVQLVQEGRFKTITVISN